MTSLDWGLLAVVALSILIGAWRGFVVEVLSLLNWAAAFFAAQWFAHDLAARLPMSGASEAMRHGAAFAALFVLALFAGGLLVWLAGKLFATPALRPADRALGSVFGLMRGVVLLLALAVVVGLSPFKGDAWWTGSRVAGLSVSTLSRIKPALPSSFLPYLP